MFKEAVLIASMCVCAAARADWGEGFESFPYTGTPDTSTLSDFTSRGWIQSNQSNPQGPQTGWHIIAGLPHGGTHAAQISFFISSFDNGVVSHWLISPQQTFRNGDTFSFWTECPDNQSSTFLPGDDDLEVRLSTAGASTNTGTTEYDIGDFQAVLIDVNPGNVTDGYPGVWTQYSITISGLPGPTSGRLALRYVAPNSSYINFIYIDDLQYTQGPCPADFNHTGGVTVQDIFDFLNAWFAGNPAADFNGNGLSVQDIFDFLNAWFAGC
jgi:hypothetical protein